MKRARVVTRREQRPLELTYAVATPVPWSPGVTIEVTYDRDDAARALQSFDRHVHEVRAEIAKHL